VNLLVITLLLSVLCQIAAAALALRLIRVTGRIAAWSFISLAIVFMALRRVDSLALALADGPASPSMLLFEGLGLVTSLLMLVGISRIRPLFEALAASREELRASNEKLSGLTEEQQLLLDHTRDFIYRHDPEGLITYVSPAVERITGFSPEEWRGPHTKHNTENPANLKGREATEEMLRTGRPGPSYVIEVRHRSGRTVWLEINKQPYVRGDAIAGFIGVARDITTRVGLEQEREKLIDELQDALARIRTLRGLLPICSSCKKVRDDKGYWSQIEAYVSDHSEAEFTHSICPDCAAKLYGKYYSPPEGREERKT
jgi:PAS domain S-box-containing protein